MTIRSLTALCTVILLAITNIKAQTIPTPKSHFGFDIGDDYKLANYSQTEAYFKKLAAADASRTRYIDIGLTEEGRHQFMLIISSAQNIKQLTTYKNIAARLARADGVDADEARQLAQQGKSVIWIDGGLHATETVGAHQLIQTAYTLLSRTDAETKRILDNNIILLVHANPDGQELVSNWYMKESDPARRNMNIPRLYQKYIGHDNNRDFMMMNMKESQNITRQQYLEWFPQIVYNHHQSGPAGSVVAGPPFRDPFNYVYDPLLVTSLDAVGSAMNSRLNREGKPGYTQRAGTEFSTWWNGGLRTATYFHNMVGLLTEIVGSPAPSNIPLVPERLIPNSATPFPVTPQTWHFRQSIEYSVSLNYAVLNYAANNREDLLYNIYQMGKNAINRGSKDNWTLSPHKVDLINSAYKASLGNAANAMNTRTSGAITMGGSSYGRSGMPVKFYDSVMHNPALRDPRGYVIPADQPDFGTAVRFVNTAIRSGVLVHKATAAFTVNSKNYPEGSYVIKTNQAFRPWVLDMFEPQDHPNDFLYPGGPPIRPYDMTGWTLAYQMGVKFDRVLDDFNGPFERVPYGKLQNPPVQPLATTKGGYLITPAGNNSFIIVNQLLAAGAEVYRIPQSKGEVIYAGSFYVPATPNANTVLAKTTNLGVKAWPIKAQSTSKMLKLKPARIALWDNYGGSMASGWTRWLFEQYKFPFSVVYPQEFDAGNLKSKYDVIVFVGGAIPGATRSAATGTLNRPAFEPPAEFSKMTGRITAEKTIPQLKAFLEAGGDIVTVGSSANLAYQLGLPIHNALIEPGTDRALSGDKFYIPGAVLRAAVDNTQPAAWGMATEADILYDNSPVFKLDADAAKKGIKPILWFATEEPLRSGWAWGQKYLKDDVTAFSAEVGRGNLYVFGPEITFRGMAHGTFKLLFNQLYVKGKKALH